MFAVLRYIFNRSRGPDWSTMPVDILECISDRLPLDDFVRFRSVCKQWRSSPSDRSELTNFSKDEPWLVLYGLEKKEARALRCYIYSQSRPRCCAFKLPDLAGAVAVESKFDWLLAHRGRSFLLYNPFTFSRIDLPRLDVSGVYACTFACLPTRRECTALVLYRANGSSLELSKCRVGDKEWTTLTIPDVGGDQIGRSMRVATCGHTRDDLCSSSCNSVFIDDPEKKNKMWYRFLTGDKAFVHNYPERDRRREAYDQGHDELWSKLKEAWSKHGKEWRRRSGGRPIWINFEDGLRGAFVINPRRDAFDEGGRFDAVRASFLEPKSVVQILVGL